MKKIFIIIGVILLLFMGLYLIYYVTFVGITKKQKYDNCLKTCTDLIIKESNKQYCIPKCKEVSGYNPSQQEKQSKNTQIKKNNTNEIEYYCEWSWPQKVIIKNTKKVVQPCTSARPWCDRADRSLENVGCCKTIAYKDCIKTKDYLSTK